MEVVPWCIYDLGIFCSCTFVSDSGEWLGSCQNEYQRMAFMFQK